MLNMICAHYCPSPFCITACPVKALSVSPRDKNIYADTDKCNRCGICRYMCLTYSRDKNLGQKRPWVAADWGRR